MEVKKIELDEIKEKLKPIVEYAEKNLHPYQAIVITINGIEVWEKERFISCDYITRT